MEFPVQCVCTIPLNTDGTGCALYSSYYMHYWYYTWVLWVISVTALQLETRTTQQHLFCHLAVTRQGSVNMLECPSYQYMPVLLSVCVIFPVGIVHEMFSKGCI